MHAALVKRNAAASTSYGRPLERGAKDCKPFNTNCWCGQLHCRMQHFFRSMDRECSRKQQHT